MILILNLIPWGILFYNLGIFDIFIFISFSFTDDFLRLIFNFILSFFLFSKLRYIEVHLFFIVVNTILAVGLSSSFMRDACLWDSHGRRFVSHKFIVNIRIFILNDPLATIWVVRGGIHLQLISWQSEKVSLLHRVVVKKLVLGYVWFLLSLVIITFLKLIWVLISELD